MKAVEKRLNQTLVRAYKQARSSTQEDWETAAELKRAGVVLPNGLRPVSPLHMEEGENLLKREENKKK